MPGDWTSDKIWTIDFDASSETADMENKDEKMTMSPLSLPLSVSLGVASLWLDLSWSRCWEGLTTFGQANSCAHCCQDEDDDDDDNDDDDHHHDHDDK